MWLVVTFRVGQELSRVPADVKADSVIGRLLRRCQQGSFSERSKQKHDCRLLLEKGDI